MDGVEMVEMTEQKRRIISLDQHDSQITSPPKRHKSSSTEISLSAKERKERIGERITALQQLVSPFGKTDTASVLTDAMEYIKFLQDQVKLLSAPYLQNTSGKAQESEQYNLRSRGLCLMPISCTLRVVRSNGADLWAPIKVNSPKM